MQVESTLGVVARWVALSALFLIPFLPLVVTSSYFFPFITGKAFFFRILVEIAFFAWVLLALIDSRYRPRLSLVGIATIAFVFWMFIADAFAPNVTKAFWSNFERMEGWVLLIHLLGFFLVSSAVLRVANKWRAWFYTNLGVSVLVMGYAVLQIAGVLMIHQGSTRVDASFGNSAYLAVYLLFTTFVALWLATTEKRRGISRWLVALAVASGVLVFFTHTRGAVLGLLGALALGAILTALTSKELRRGASILLLAIIVCVGGIYIARDSTFIQESPTLKRITSISLADGGTRFTLWGMALEGVKERPLLGWGQEGFNYVFNAHYDPSLYEQEPWFDRAHNTFVDWLSAGGIPAFLLYISLFGTGFFLLWRAPDLSRGERIALTAALAGYACHNFFVFDNLYSYVYFFAILALIDSQVSRPIAQLDALPKLSGQGVVTLVTPITLVIALVTLYTVNGTGMQASARLIDALSVSTGGLEKSISIFEGFAENPPFAAQEIREQLVTFTASAIASSAVTDEDKQRIASLAVSEMQKHVEKYPRDARLRIQLAHLYRAAGASESALIEIHEAIQLSPERPSFWIEAGAAEWDSGDTAAARESFMKAYELGRQFPQLAVYAAAGAIATGAVAEGKTILRDALGTDAVDSDILAAAYYRAQAWNDLIILWRARTEREDASAQAWFSLAAAQYASGDSTGAIETLRTAEELFPETAAASAAARAEIEAAFGKQ
jgi:O-antigen ligase